MNFLAVGRDLHVHSHPSKLEHWRHLVEIVALTIAALWGLYVFVYQEKIKPATAAPEVLRTVTVDHTNLQSGKEFVKVNVELKNIGESRVDVGAIIANLYGLKFSSKPGHQVTTPLPGIEKTNFALQTSEPQPLFSFFDTWKSVGAMKPGNVTISPGQTWNESFVVGIHPGEYDIAEVVLDVCVSHETSGVWAGKKVYQKDGTAWLAFTGSHPGLDCVFQRNGLYYPL